MNRIVLLLLVACFAAPFALYCYAMGVLPYGNGYPGGSSELCILDEALPPGAEVAVRDPASDAATIRYTRVPLGFVCRVQLTGPPRTAVIEHQSWPATVGWLAASATVALTIALAIAHGFVLLREERRRSPTQPREG